MLKTIIFSIIIFVVAVTCKANTINLGIIAETYPVIEENALILIQEKAKKIEIPKERIANKIKNFQFDSVDLPDASEHEIFSIRPKHTLEYDILGKDKKIIYPKGYTFYPLDFIKNKTRYVIINGNNKDHVKWFKSSPYLKCLNTTFMINKGNWFSLSNELNERVFLAFPEIIKAFKISALPAIIIQEDGVLKVEQIAIN